MASAGSVDLVLPDGYPAAADVDTSSSSRPGDHSDSVETATGVVDDEARAARSGDGNVLASPPGDRVNSGAGGSSRRFNVQETGLRGVIDPLPLVLHGLDAGSTTGTGDLQSSGLDQMAGLGGDAIDPSGAASLVGWAPGTAMPALISLAYPSGRIVGPDGRAWPGGPGVGVSAAGGGPMDSVGLFVPDAAFLGTTQGDVRSATDLHADVDSPIDVVADPDRGGPATAWADILASALHPDWEAVDGELRQFLSRLGDLDRAAVGEGAGPVWLLWIGAATILILARRASHGPWLPFRRAAPWAVGVPGRHPVPVGPWPLGPP